LIRPVDQVQTGVSRQAKPWSYSGVAIAGGHQLWYSWSDRLRCYLIQCSEAGT